MGVGMSIGAVEVRPHWDQNRAKQDNTTNNVPWRVEYLQETPFIELQDLTLKWSQMDWTPQSSGVEIKIPEAITFLVEAGLALRTGSRMAEEVNPGMAYAEGAVTTVTVNGYERDPKARRKCLNHYGSRCQACEKTMAEIYGPIGEGMIHVHHRMPLHAIGRAYQVDPIHDLVPVCPNCHAILHRGGTVLTVEQLREMLTAR